MCERIQLWLFQIILTTISYSVSAGICGTNSLLIQLLCGLSANKHL